jgi:hypothetical protein
LVGEPVCLTQTLVKTWKVKLNTLAEKIATFDAEDWRNYVLEVFDRWCDWPAHEPFCRLPGLFLRYAARFRFIWNRLNAEEGQLEVTVPDLNAYLQAYEPGSEELQKEFQLMGATDGMVSIVQQAVFSEESDLQAGANHAVAGLLAVALMALVAFLHL